MYVSVIFQVFEFRAKMECFENSKMQIFECDFKGTSVLDLGCWNSSQMTCSSNSLTSYVTQTSTP